MPTNPNDWTWRDPHNYSFFDADNAAREVARAQSLAHLDCCTTRCQDVDAKGILKLACW